MIALNMATTLSFLMTDAPVDRVWLRQVLREEVDATFNAVTVDGDTSTNDSCFLLASGAAGGPVLRGDDRAGRALRQMVHEVLDRLARQLVRGGEGATRVVEIDVVGAENEREAPLGARRGGNSPLVKTPVGGGGAQNGDRHA